MYIFSFHKHVCFRPIAILGYSKQVKMVAILEGGGAYGFKTVNPDPRKGEASCPVSDALQLMLAFGGFILGILTFVVLLIEKISKKK